MMSDGVLLNTARAAAAAGAEMLQLRVKKAEPARVFRLAAAIRGITKRHGAIFIVNDRAEAAVSSGADGLHVGRGDIGMELARKLLGPGKMIGASCSKVSEARSLKRRRADYIGFGPVFSTPLKKGCEAVGSGAFRKLRALGIPSFAIGGIGLNRVEGLKRDGVERLAVIRAVCASKDPYRAASALRKAIS